VLLILIIFFSLIDHSVPISKMGDYHQAETKIQYFRDVFQDEETTKWLQKIMFGNPFLKYKVRIKK